MNKIIIIVLFLLTLVPFSYALELGEMKSTVYNITKSEGFGSGGVRFASYEVNKNYLAYISCKHGDCLITFYRASFGLSKDELRCLTLHELGHWKDYQIGSKGILSEFKANDYMQSKKEDCKRYKE